MASSSLISDPSVASFISGNTRLWPIVNGGVTRWKRIPSGNPDERRIEMHLVSHREQVVEIGECVLEFGTGETIHTENSSRYRPDVFRKIAEEAGCRLPEFGRATIQSSQSSC
jgi:hypothetical protein